MDSNVIYIFGLEMISSTMCYNGKCCCGPGNAVGQSTVSVAVAAEKEQLTSHRERLSRAVEVWDDFSCSLDLCRTNKKDIRLDSTGDNVKGSGSICICVKESST